jgi:hypothetical protein
MALPSTGSLSMSQVAVELSRSATAQIALGEAAVRNLANLPSGPIGLLNLRGKSAAIIYTASNLASLNLATAFGTDYGVAVDKRLIVPAGIALGPVTIPTGLAGSLTIENAGEIQGLGGAANGGAGGDAITASVSFTLLNTGAVRGGGGGGGLGGVGGNGSFSSTTTITEGPFQANTSTGYYWREPGACGGGFVKFWAKVSVSDGGGITYIRGTGRGGPPAQFVCGGPQMAPAFLYYDISRQIVSTTTSTTSGGAGGGGGIGRGYNQNLASGAGGVAGGTNAGTGGTGGTGGDWGQAGATGNSGANGNSTNGAAGSAGGPAGRAIRMLSGSLTLTNFGTINGAY